MNSLILDDSWLALKDFQSSSQTLTLSDTSDHVIDVAWNDAEGVVRVCLSENSNETHDSTSSWSAFYTINGLNCLHQQLCTLCPDVADHPLPQLPYQPTGIWYYFLTTKVPNDFCQSLTDYFNVVLKTSGSKLFKEVLFGASALEEEDYLMNQNELIKEGYENELNSLKGLLQEKLTHKETIEDEEKMTSYYTEEDAVLDRMDVVRKRILDCDLRPLITLRDASSSKRSQLQSFVDNDQIREDEKVSVAQNLCELGREYDRACQTIGQLQINYHKTRRDDILENCKRVQGDVEKFVEGSLKMKFSHRLEQLERLGEEETLKLLKARKSLLTSERDKIQREMVMIDDSATLQDQIGSNEKSFYQKQKKIHELEEQILQTEESLLKRKLKDESLKDKSKIHSKLQRISRKKAVLRNKMKACQREVDKSSNQSKSVVQSFSTHAVQLRRDQQKEAEEKKKDVVEEERRKTIQRLRQFKAKYQDLDPQRRSRTTSSPHAGRRERVSSTGSTRLSGSSTTTTRKTTSQTISSRSTTKNAVENSKPKPDTTESNTSAVQTRSPSPPPTPPPPPPPPPPPLAPVPPPPPPPLAPPTLPNSSPSLPKSPAAVKIRPVNDCQKDTSRSVFDLDGVIAARQRLRKVEPGKDQGGSDSTQRGFDDVVTLIKSGVKLRKVSNQEKEKKVSGSLGDDGAQFLREALARMHKVAAPSSDEESSDDEDFED